MDTTLRWAPITTSSSEPNSLFLGWTEIARLSQRVDDGSWFATLHMPGREPIHRKCTSHESGKAGCEQWAQRHFEVLANAAELDVLETRSRTSGLALSEQELDRLRALRSRAGLLPAARLVRVAEAATGCLR